MSACNDNAANLRMIIYALEDAIRSVDDLLDDLGITGFPMLYGNNKKLDNWEGNDGNAC